MYLRLVCVNGILFEKFTRCVYTNPGLLRDMPASYHRATASHTGRDARYLSFVNLCPTQLPSKCLHFTRGSNRLRALRWVRMAVALIMHFSLSLSQIAGSSRSQRGLKGHHQKSTEQHTPIDKHQHTGKSREACGGSGARCTPV